MGAATIAQSASQPADWQLVAGQWQQAIQSLQAIPQGDPNYEPAQAKLAEYQQNLAIAQQKAGAQAAPSPQAVASPASNEETYALSSEASPTANPAAAGMPNCNGVAAPRINDVGNLTRLTFQLAEVDEFDGGVGAPEPGEKYLFGCFTNHSNQMIAGIRMGYSYSSGGSMGGGMSSLNFRGDAIAPGQTVLVRSHFTFDPNVRQVEIGEISTSAGSVALNRTVSP